MAAILNTRGWLSVAASFIQNELHMDSPDPSLRRLRWGFLAALLVVGFPHSAFSQLPLAFASTDPSGQYQVWQGQMPSNWQDPNVPIPPPTIVAAAGIGSQESRAPDWSTTGKIAYQFGSSGYRKIFTIDPSGSNNARLIPSLSDLSDQVNPSWSPDGKNVVFARLRKWLPDVPLQGAIAQGEESVIRAAIEAQAKQLKDLEDGTFVPAAIDPFGLVLPERGGDWGSLPGNCRAAARSSNPEIAHFGSVGFRLARTADCTVGSSPFALLPPAEGPAFGGYSCPPRA